MREPLTLRLFGPFEARVDGSALPHLLSCKGQQLLALLALRAGCPLERAWLAGTLWSENTEEHALRSLRTSLWDLRRALGPEAGRLQSPTLHTLILDLSGADVDLLAFDAAITRGGTAE